MLARVYTAALHGLLPQKIEVEVDGVRGIPGFTLIGLPSKAVDEAKERVTAALTNCGIRIRSKRTIVNLAPADVQKVGSGFDLAIAVGLLKMYGELQFDSDKTLFLGELSLDGSLKPVRGVLSLVLSAPGLGFKRVVVPACHVNELQVVTGVEIILLKRLQDLLAWGHTGQPLTILKPRRYQPPISTPPRWNHIVGQTVAKRALTIAAAGWHHVLMTGPPGVGKSELAQVLPQLLPPLTEQEAIEVTQLFSLTESLSELVTHRPFRSPHHSISVAGLLGGGTKLKPRELPLSHHGVLFLDELPEFNRACLEALRQPLETHQVKLHRAQGTVSYPAQSLLVAAANPCPCGNAGSSTKKCVCGETVRAQYWQRISGPLRDRFDLQVWVSEVAARDISLSSKVTTMPSESNLLSTISAARKRQEQRWKPFGYLMNSQVPWEILKTQAHIEPAAHRFVMNAYSAQNLSMRGLVKTMRVALTIADLAASDTLALEHLAEAFQYRESTI